MVKLDPAVSAQLRKVQNTDNQFAANVEAKKLGEMLGKMALKDVRSIESTATQLYGAISSLLMDEGHVLNAAGKVAPAFHAVVSNEATDPGVRNYNKMMIKDELRT